MRESETQSEPAIAPEWSQLIPVARLARATPHPARWRVTTGGGGGLVSLPRGSDVFLYRPAYRGTDSKQIHASVWPHPHAGGEVFSARLVTHRIGEGSDRGWVELRAPAAPPDLSGCWICVPRAALAGQSDGFYFFELLDLPVFAVTDGQVEAEPLGRVSGFIDTAAHGVLRTRLLDGDQEVLVPFVEQYVEILRPAGQAGRVLVRDYRDFLV